MNKQIENISKLLEGFPGIISFELLSYAMVLYIKHEGEYFDISIRRKDLLIGGESAEFRASLVQLGVSEAWLKELAGELDALPLVRDSFFYSPEKGFLWN